MCHTALLPIRVYASRYEASLAAFFFLFDFDLDFGAGVTFSRLKGFLEEAHAPYFCFCFLLFDFGI
jgi:hypothetical protein